MRVDPGGLLGAKRSAWGRAAWLIAITLAASTACRLPYIPPVTPPPPSAIADLADASGRVVGRAVLIEQSDGVRILLDLTGVPAGIKAVHLHEVGRCDPPSFESAGGHFNPTKAQHGTANPRGPHAGDLPNVTVEKTGRGHLEATASRVTLVKGSAPLLGPNGGALVLHEGPDDLRTDPAGNSGARIACGVIRRAS
jgi:superoxide dismutase, Cu-Zn family